MISYSKQTFTRSEDGVYTWKEEMSLYVQSEKINFGMSRYWIHPFQGFIEILRKKLASIFILLCRISSTRFINARS